MRIRKKLAFTDDTSIVQVVITLIVMAGTGAVEDAVFMSLTHDAVRMNHLALYSKSTAISHKP